MGWDYPPPPPNLLTNKHRRIGAIILGASAFLPIGVIAAPIAIETVPVGDAGNAPDSRYNGINVGSVTYDYRIGTYEVTNEQYIAFLNAVDPTGANELGLFNTTDSTYYGIEWSNGTYAVKSGYENKPVNFVTFWDAVRFCNWMTTGNDTEDGMYTLTPDGIAYNTVIRNDDVFQNGGVAIASEDEWYKAAYYKGGSTNAGYWDYPVQQDDINSDDANYGYTTEIKTVGSYEDKTSTYGTYDQGGNLFEWTDHLGTKSQTRRIIRGGSFLSQASALGAEARDLALGNDDVSYESADVGFRVVSLAPIVVPEPQTYALFDGIALLGMTILRRRKK